MSNLKPVTFKKSDIKTKSKVIGSAYWSHLKGNKAPYLSVSIKQVKKDGKTLNSWQDNQKSEYENTIKTLCPDLYDLYDNHFCSMDDYNKMHEISNGYYYIEQTRKFLWSNPVTVEQKREELQQLKQSVIDDFNDLVNLLKIKGHLATLDKFRQSLQDRQKSDYYNHPMYSKDTMINWFCNNIAGFGKQRNLGKQVELTLNDIFNNVESIRKLRSDLNYPTTRGWINESDIWTVERLAKYFDLSVDQTTELVLNCKGKDDLKELFKQHIENRKNRLQELTEKYNIPVIHS